MSADKIIRDDRACWVNEDCIAGWHMDEIECRFPSWKDEAGRSPVGHGVPIAHEAMVDRISRDPSFREGWLAAAILVESLRVHVDDDPYSTCPDGCGWFNYAAKMIREQLAKEVAR